MSPVRLWKRVLFLRRYWKWRASWKLRSRGGADPGAFENRKPAPIRPSPTHHLTALKDLPPGDRTHSLPKD